MHPPTLLLLAIFLFSCSTTDGLDGDTATPKGIYPNQVGYAPSAPKLANMDEATSFNLLESKSGKVVFSGKTTPTKPWTYTGEHASIADFSEWKKPGEYVLAKGEEKTGARIRIKKDPYLEVYKASLKSFYYQRASVKLEEKYAGKWARKAGHPDSQARVYKDATSPLRPEGSVVSSSGGWYDAGDYGKYTAPAAVSTATMLSLYEHFPNKWEVDIPTTHGLPPLLEECRYSLGWLQTMQAPEGFACHKLTTRHHAKICVPAEDVEPRYLIGKSTSATLDLAAVMAQASRVYKPFDKIFADSCLAVAQRAWQWAIQHPNVEFKNPDGVDTGEYQDDDFKDEWLWAAAELYITTGDDRYYQKMDVLGNQFHDPPSWRHTQPLGLLSLVHHSENLDPEINPPAIIQTFLDYAQRFADYANQESPWRSPMGVSEYDFIWGSNGKCANMGMVLMYAYRLTGDQVFLAAGLGALDYLLGRNPTGYCFVTGFGSRSPMHIHHRPSEADGVDLPVPGLLAGGPQNYFNPDDCVYPSEKPALKYLDDWCSYSTNEVAIYWNAPLVYLAGAATTLLRE